MIDISCLLNYTVPIDSFDIDYYRTEVAKKGFDAWFEYELKSNLDCTKVLKDGTHINQTIGYAYSSFMIRVLESIKEFVDESNRDKYYELLIKQHNDNIEFEKVNPPTWYGGEKEKAKYSKTYKKSTSRKKVKQEDLNIPGAPKKQSVAERKLAAKVAKLNALSFKIKPVQ